MVLRNLDYAIKEAYELLGVNPSGVRISKSFEDAKYISVGGEYNVDFFIKTNNGDLVLTSPSGSISNIILPAITAGRINKNKRLVVMEVRPEYFEDLKKSGFIKVEEDKLESWVKQL